MQQRKAQLERLPEVLQTYCLRYLDAESLCAVGGSCHIIRVISHRERLWRDLYSAKFNAYASDHVADTTTFVWKARYRRRLQVERNWKSGRFRVRFLKQARLSGWFDAANVCEKTHLCVLESKRLLCIDLNGRKVVASISGNFFRQTSHGKKLFTAHSFDFSIAQWTFPGLRRVRSFERYHKMRITGMESDGTTLVSSSIDGTVGIWDVRTGKCTERFVVSTATPIISLAVDFASSKVYAATWNNSVQVWQFSRRRSNRSDKSGCPPRLLAVVSDFHSCPWRLHLDLERRQLIVNDSITDPLGVEQACVRVLDLSTLQTIRTHVSERKGQDPLRFAVHGNWIAFPFSRQEIAVVDRRTDEHHRFVVPLCTSEVEIVFNGMTPFSMVLYGRHPDSPAGQTDKFRIVDFAADL